MYVKKRGWVVVLAAVLMLCVGCGEKSAPAAPQRVDQSLAPSESASNIPEKDSTPEAEPDTGTDALGLPKMTKENQGYYDKYLKPFYAAYPLFVYSFGEGSWEFAEPARIYSCLAKPDAVREDSAAEVEKLISQWFPMTSADAKALSSFREYNAEKDVYSVGPVDNITQDSSCGVVTASSLSDGVLTLTCDWYQTVYPGTPGTYEKRSTAITKIRLDAEDQWYYLSNESDTKHVK